MELRHSPGGAFVDDPASRGHVIHGHVVMDDDSDVLTLDDRLGDLPGQLVVELRRVAEIYTDLADLVEAKGGAACNA